MADRVGYAGDDVATEMEELTSPRMGDGSLLRSKDEWGSIIDILKNIETTTHPGKPPTMQPVVSPVSPRLAPLSENIQSSGIMSPTEVKQGQGLQQLDHLVRMMEQMCHLQKQNSRLREQAEYLVAIKDLQELRNESLMQNCNCEAQRRSSDISRVPDETFSEPESTVGDEMEPRREQSPPREKRTGRSIKREPKTKSMKKRSRSLDPYRKVEPQEKEGDRERERGRPGIFSKFERMKEKLTTRRGSVKKHTVNKRNEDKQDDDLRTNADRPEMLSNDHFNLQMDGTETKSEDSGIFHVGLDDIVNLPRLPAEILPKLQDELSDNEDVFTALQPSWNRTNDFSMETRKGSDFSTESSSEDYLEVKPKRTSAPQREEPVTLRRSPELQRRRVESEERAVKSCDENEESVHCKMRVRRSASLQDNASLNSDDDDEFEKAAKASWEVKEAPAILQRGHSDKSKLESSPSNDFDFSDVSLDMQTGHDSASTSSLESKAAQKRKYFRKSQRIEEPTSPTVASEVKSPKSSPPEKKRHKVGWEKVKHVVTRKHIGDINKSKATTSMDESILRSSEEPSSPTDSSPPEDSDGKVKRSEVKKVEQKREKVDPGPPPSSETQPSPLALYESLQANLSEDFAKKMEKWDKKKQKHGSGTGMIPLERAKQSSFDSCSSDAGTLPPSDLEAELQKGLTEDFYKKLAEWDKLKQHKGVVIGPTSPKGEPKNKQKAAKEGKKSAKSTKSQSKDKDRDKNKGKESPQQRSKSPEATAPRKISPPPEAIYATEGITVFAKQGGKLKLEGASKEFSKKYKEWEKKEKKKKNSPPLRPEDISSPVMEQAQPLPSYYRDGSSLTSSSPTVNESVETTVPGDLYVIAHATPVIVEPDYNIGDGRHHHARAGDPIFRTQSAPPATSSVSEAASQGGRANSKRTVLTEEDIFTEEPASQPIPKERVNRLEQRNSFLAEQLKLDDVNLQAVQDEIVDVEEQLAEITGEKSEDRMERRVSTCSSIGESTLEAELSDIKTQIAQLEEHLLRRRPHHKSHRGVKGQDEVERSPESIDKKVDENTSDFTAFPISSVAAEVQTQTEQLASEQAAAAEEVSNNSTLVLEKSLQEREAIIKLLQARLDRQALEINYLKNGSDAASMFRRAKSFTAKDKKTFDPRSMKIIDILQEKPEGLTDTLQSENRSESSKSLKTDSMPSLETLHISAEDIRMDETAEEKSDNKEPTEDKKSLKIQERKSPDANEEKPQEMPVAESAKQTPIPQPVDTAAQEEYPGLYGPIETKHKRRRTRSIEPPLSPTEDAHAKHNLTKDGHSTDAVAAVDSLLAKKEGDQSKMQEDENLSPRSPRPRKTSEKDDGNVQAPLSPSTKKVMPKIALVKLADGLKSQAVELSPRTQRKQDMVGQEDKDADRRSPRGGRGSPRVKQEMKESTSPSESKEIKLANSKDEKLKLDEKEEKEPASPVGQAKSRRETSPEKQPSLRSRRPLAGRTLSSETLPVTSLMSSSREKEPTSIRMQLERRTSVEDLRGMIERRQRSFSTETAESDQEPQSNAKNSLESRQSGRILPERRDSSESVGSNKQAPSEKREPVLMRNQKPVDKSVSSLRRKFAVQEFGSTPNVSDLSLLTGRKEKERPKEGCVKQMTQAFSLVSLNDQGAEIRRSSKSSSVRSSPQSLSPASSNSSISNVVANQIKRLQEKASSSPETPERRPSVQMTKSPKDSGPSLYSIRGRLEHRQSLTNVADVRAKFDKKKESAPNTGSPPPSPSATNSPSPQQHRARKDNTAKPTLVSSVAAARIKYTVSVSNSVDSGPPKKSVSTKENGSARTQRLVAVIESPNIEKTGKADSNVTTFTVNGQKRRQNSSQSSPRHEENNNNSNNNNRNNSVKVDVHRKGSCTNTAEVSNKPAEEKQGKRDKDNEESGPSRRASVTKNDRRRGSLPRQTDPPRDASRRSSVTKGKESPKEAARRRSVSKESQKSVSRRGSLSKGQDSSNESSRGKAASKDAEPSKEASSLHVPGAEPEEDDRGRRRRRRRERSTPSPEHAKAQAEAVEIKPQAKADIKTVSDPDVKSEVKPKVNTTVKQEVRQEVKEKEVKQDILKENQTAVKMGNKQSDQQKVKPEVKSEVKTETKHRVKSEVKSDTKHEVKPVPKSEAKPEVKVEVKPDREQERKNRREQRARRQKEREEEAARVKAEKEKEEAKKAAKVVRKESQKEEKRELRKEKIDLKKKTTSELTQPVAGSSASHGIRRRHSKREEQKPSEVPSKMATAEVAKSEEEEPMPDLLAQAQKKTAGESSTAEDMIGGRSPRAILTNSALRGAEAVIGHALPKSTLDEEESKEDPVDERRSRKDATRRSRAINRGSRISRLDIFRRARSVDSSKASKERSPDRLLGGGGASDRSRSVDRSGKNRDKSPGGEETRKGGSWLSKRTGSISNFLRPSNIQDQDLWDELDECYRILQSCTTIYRPAYEYEDMWQLRFIQETSILS